MIRILIVCYRFVIRSERRFCEGVHPVLRHVSGTVVHPCIEF
jgi:hypothetical protein